MFGNIFKSELSKIEEKIDSEESKIESCASIEELVSIGNRIQVYKQFAIREGSNKTYSTTKLTLTSRFVTLYSELLGKVKENTSASYEELISNLKSSNFYEDIRTYSTEKNLVIDCVVKSPSTFGEFKNNIAESWLDLLDEISDEDFSIDNPLSLINVDYFDNLFKQILLSTNSISDKGISSVIWNVYYDEIDKSTGRHIRICLLSVEVDKHVLSTYNLEKVDYTKCISMFIPSLATTSEETDTMISARPIKTFEESFKTIDTEEIIDSLSINSLMEISWQEFEVLVRDWLRKEFPEAQVDVTQSSRDDGLDGIILDSDYLRGGKIYVQCKQYSKTVPVSAVRELYGVMQAQKAIKGILVTTSSFGFESKKFAKENNISLVDGKTFVSELNKYGYNLSS